MTETEEKADRLEQFALARYFDALLFTQILLQNDSKVVVNGMDVLATGTIKFSSVWSNEKTMP